MKGEDGEEEDGEEEDGEEEDGEEEDENKETKGQEVDENKEIEEQQGGMDENKGGQVPEIDVLVKNKKKSKYRTLNIFGFTLPFQVWAVERITRLSTIVGTQFGTGFPRFTRWNFNRRVVDIDKKFITSKEEKRSDYYKSLTPDYVCGPLLHKGKGLLKAAQTVIEKEDEVGSEEDDDQNFDSSERSPDEPLSRKKLFDDTDFQTHKSTFQTCIQPSTIADLYSAIASLIKESDSNTVKLIKESEERQMSCFRAELGKIREEMKVGDRPSKKSREDNAGTSKQKNDKDYEEDLNGENLCKEVEKNDVQGDDAHKHSSDPVIDALADSQMVEDVDKQTILNETELKEINKCVNLCIEEIVQQTKPLTKKSIHLDDVASPSVVAYDVADPRVTYKDHDKARARKRSRYLNMHWVNPLASKRLKPSSSDKPSTQGDITDVEFMAFLKTKQPNCLYTGQIKLMEHQEFKELVDPRKLINDMHIHSYFDVLWKKRSTPDVNYLQNIALANVTFFMNLKWRWDIEMEEMDSARAIKEVEMSEQEKGNEGKVKENRKTTRVNKKKDPPPPAVEVWEEYPEFDPLEFQPPSDWLQTVAGHELLYSDPWWKMDSVLIPYNTGNHWVLCHVFLKKGHVHLYDSLWPRNGNSARLKDIRCLFYFLPSILKNSGYYAETKSDPHTSAFTATNISHTLIPQQNDGYSCGVFLLKYAELILSGVRLLWKNDFSQKDIPAIRKAMACDIFTNAQLVNSP